MIHVKAFYTLDANLAQEIENWLNTLDQPVAIEFNLVSDLVIVIARPTSGATDGSLVDGADSNIKASIFDFINSNPLAVQTVDRNGDPADLSRFALTPVSGVASSAGNNTVLTPSLGKALRVHYLAYNPASPAEVAFRFGVAGPLFLRNNLTVSGAVIAKDFGDSRYVIGAIDEVLILNLSSPVSVVWNAFYVEV